MEQNTSPDTLEQNTATVVDEGTGETISETKYSYGGKEWRSVDDLGKSYEELQSSFSKKMGAFVGSPEEYALAEGIEESNITSMLAEWGKENQLSNDGFNSLVEASGKLIESIRESEDKEFQEMQNNALKELGDNAPERVQNAKDYMKANFGDEYAERINPADVDFVEKIMALTKNSTPANVNSTPAYDKEKLDYMQFQEKDAHGNRRYQTDPEFRKKVLELREGLRG